MVLAVAQPVHARKVNIGVSARVHPRRFTAGHLNYAHTHDGIRFARLRETGVFIAPTGELMSMMG